MSEPVVRPFENSDTEAILDLFTANIRRVVPDPQRDGYVHGRLTPQVLASFVAEDGLRVVTVSDRVVGVACSSWPSVDRGPEPAREIARAAKDVVFGGATIAERKWFMYGPVVIEREFRGQGLLRLLFESVRESWRGQAEVGVCFIETGNVRAMGSHVKGLGLTRIGSLDVDGQGYFVLAFYVS